MNKSGLRLGPIFQCSVAGYLFRSLKKFTGSFNLLILLPGSLFPYTGYLLHPQLE